MNIEKIKIRDDFYLIAVTDNKDNVIAAGAFEHQWEAETAAAIVNTVFVKKGKATKGSVIKLNDFINMMAAQKSEVVS